MKKEFKNKYLLAVFFCLACFVPQIFINQMVGATSGTNFQIKIKAVCGNEVQEWNEDCDNEDLGSGTCITEGFNSGSLSCEDDCTYNTSECIIIIPPEDDEEPVGSVAVTPQPTVPTPPVQTSVVFMGYAYPDSQVVLLKDAQVSATANAGDDGRFSISLSGISSGVYVFALSAKDQNDVNSALVTFPLVVNSGTTNEVSGVFIPPTVSINKSRVVKGNNLLVSGWTAPQAQVSVVVENVDDMIQTTQANNEGYYKLNLETTDLNNGEYFVNALSSLGTNKSFVGRHVSFYLDDQPTEAIKEVVSRFYIDLTEDGKINLADFNIGLYWYNKPLDDNMAKKEREFFNGDGKFDLVDFSIMAYHWTG